MANLFKTKSIFILSFIFFSCISFSQIENTENKSIKHKKNVFYGTIGIDYWELYGTVMGNYERLIFEIPKSNIVQSFWIRIGAGPWRGGFDYPEKGWNFASTLSAQFGRKSNHLEIGAGTLFTYNEYYKRFEPLVRNQHLAGHLAGNIGYRFQKPTGDFIFRAGIGWPEFTYI